MNARNKHRHGPVEAYEVVEDFLPSPDELAFKEDTVKVTAGGLPTIEPTIVAVSLSGRGSTAFLSQPSITKA